MGKLFQVIILLNLAGTAYANDKTCKKELQFPLDASNSEVIAELNTFIIRESDPSEEVWAKPGDNRKVRSTDSPKWLEAVGKLNRPDGTCSAELIGGYGDIASSVAVTNYHCINKYLNSTHSLEDISITFTSNSGRVFKVGVESIYDHGGDLYNDWAILILDRHIRSNQIKPLIPSDEEIIEFKESLEDELASYKETAAGYSGDLNRNLGNSAKNLTYDEDCQVIESEGYFESNYATSKSCHTYPGSSGGAYVVTYSDDLGDADPLLFGIINGSLVDENGMAVTVKVSNIIDELEGAIDQHNIMED